MKTLISICLLISSVSSYAEQTLETLEVSYRAATLNLSNKRGTKIDTLDQQFIKALEKIQERYQKAGDLDRALLAQAEVKLIEAKTWPLPALPEQLKRKMKTLRQTYLKSRVGIDRKWAVATAKAGDAMEKALAAEISALTKAGKLKEAQKGREILEKVKTDPELTRARELPKRVTAGGQSKAALILRRPGDDLEVLVRYDRTGKVSMDSPIENLVERTGGRREKGLTKAKTLGQFVGAEGYEVDSYLAFSQNTKKGKIAFSNGHGTRFKKLTTVSGERALELEIAPNATNATLNLDGVIPVVSQPGTVQITTGYLIPKSNRSITGLTLVHGNSKGGHFGSSLTKKGAWAQESREGVSSTEFSNLRIHFRGLQLGNMKDAWGDKIFLRSLEIRHVCFSALVVERYDTSGGLVEKESSASSQKIFIRNGKFLPTN